MWKQQSRVQIWHIKWGMSLTFCANWTGFVCTTCSCHSRWIFLTGDIALQPQFNIESVYESSCSDVLCDLSDITLDQIYWNVLLLLLLTHLANAVMNSHLFNFKQHLLMLVERKPHSVILEEFYSCPFLFGNVLYSAQVFNPFDHLH